MSVQHMKLLIPNESINSTQIHITSHFFINKKCSEVAVNLVKLEYIILQTHLTPIHLSIQATKNSVTAHIL